MNELAARIAAYGPVGDRDAFPFSISAGTHPTRQNFGRSVLDDAVNRAELQGRAITWRLLRHTAVSLLFDAGLTIFHVQRRLGHHSPVVTAEVYYHPVRER